MFVGTYVGEGGGEEKEIKSKINSCLFSNRNIAVMKDQLLSLGCHFDWNRVSCCGNNDIIKTMFVVVVCIENVEVTISYVPRKSLPAPRSTTNGPNGSSFNSISTAWPTRRQYASARSVCVCV